jgi:hypothetical protein
MPGQLDEKKSVIHPAPTPLFVSAAKEESDMNISRKRILSSVGATATTLALLFTVGCSSGSSTTPPPVAPAADTNTPAADTNTPAAYPASAAQNFMSSCEQTSNGDVAYCQCALNWFQANRTYTQFLADEDMVRAGQIPADVTTAENACGQ